MNEQEIAHRRLLNAVISFVGATQNGSKAEIKETAIELEEATKNSESVLYHSGEKL